MSVVQIQGNAGGTGTLTIASPNTNSSYTATLPQQTGTLVAGTSTANAVIPAGTTAIAPVLLTSGTNLTSATAGALEYDGKVVYATPQGTQRGIVPAAQTYVVGTAVVGANATGAQSLFGVGVTVSASTRYKFEMVFAIQKSAGTTSHTISLLWGGTATFNDVIIWGAGGSGGSLPDSSTSNTAQFATNSPGAVVLTAALTSASSSLHFCVKGTFSVNAGGTIIPQYSLSAAPGGAYSTLAQSRIEISPLGGTAGALNVGTWA